MRPSRVIGLVEHVRPPRLDLRSAEIETISANLDSLRLTLSFRATSAGPAATSAGPAAAALWILGIGSDVPLSWSPPPRRGAGLGPGWRVSMRPPERKSENCDLPSGPSKEIHGRYLQAPPSYRGHPETRACPATGLHLHTKPPTCGL